MTTITHDFKFEDRKFQFSFNANDTYPNTGLGCHTGALASLRLIYQPGTEWDTNQLTTQLYNKVRQSDLSTKIVEYLVKWTKDTPIGAYLRSHFFISANYSFYKYWPRKDIVIWHTYDIMDIIMDHCDRDPKKYGTYAVCQYTDNMAHGPSAVSRSMIWVPPHVPRKEQLQHNWRSLLPVPGEKVKDNQPVEYW